MLQTVHRLLGPNHLSESLALPISLLLSALVAAPGALAQPELTATARSMYGVATPRMSAEANQSNFSLGTDQSKFNLGTSRKQSSAKSAVGLKVDRENPAIMTIVGHNEADIERLLAKRYHRAVVPLVPYEAPAGPMQQVTNQQQIEGQVITQQVVAQQGIVAQQPGPQNSWCCQNIAAVPVEMMHRFFNILAPNARPPVGEMSAEAKPLKPFGQPTYIRWDPWYNRIKSVANGHWQKYNNQVNTEVTAHVIVSSTGTLAVTAVDFNLWKIAAPGTVVLTMPLSRRPWKCSTG